MGEAEYKVALVRVPTAVLPVWVCERVLQQ